jgi:hypothetical protein
MVKIHDIVDEINTALQVQFAAKRFQKGSFDGIGELLTIDGERFPCLVDNSGTTTKLIIDDVKPFQVYHRHIRTEFKNSEQDFGDRISITGTSNMLMIVIGDRSRLQLTLEDIISGVAAGWPLTLSKTTLNTLELQKCDIVPGQFNIDKEAVYKGEYSSAEFILKPHNIMFSFSYQIVTELDQVCFVLCE